MPQPSGPGFFRQRIDDANAAVIYIRSLWGILSMSRQRRGLETQLAETHQQIGAAAEQAQIGADLPAMQGARDVRIGLTQAQAELDLRKAELAAAQERRRQEDARHNQLLVPIEADCGRLEEEEFSAASAVKSAQQQLGQIERDMRRVESMLSTAAQGKPVPQPIPALQQQVAALQQAIGPARQSLAAVTEKHSQAAGADAQKRSELDQAKDARRLALAACDEEIGRCNSAVGEGETFFHKCEAALAAAHSDLGKAVLEANLSGEEIDDPLGRARSLMQQIATIVEQSSRTRAQAGANRGGAIRSAAALVVVVLAISLAWMVAAKLLRPRQPLTVGGSTQPAPAAAAGQPIAGVPMPSPGAMKKPPTDSAAGLPSNPTVQLTSRLAASTDVSPVLEKAILALPKLSSTTCQVTGKLAVGEVTSRAGSVRLMQFSVPVETRASAQAKPLTGTALVRVLVSPQDRILSSDVTLPDPELAELEALGRK